MELSLLKIVQEGGFIQPDYNNRLKVPVEFVKDIWNMVDQERLKKEIALNIERELADRVINQIAAELSSDVKSILSVKERREAIRSVARNHLDDICSGKLSSHKKGV